eukprot:210026-Chlamydomonas_euryale.AAC.1
MHLCATAWCVAADHALVRDCLVYGHCACPTWSRKLSAFSRRKGHLWKWTSARVRAIVTA